MANVVVVTNQKGGIGKTFLSSALAYLLSTDSHSKVPETFKRSAERVLLVDADFQGDSTFFITRMDRDEFEGKSLMEAINTQDATDYIFKVSETLSVLPASSKLAEFDKLFTENKSSIFEPARLMERALENLADDYDWIIIDTSPSLSQLKIQTLNISLGGFTNVLIPLQTETFGLDSVVQFSDTLTAVKSKTNPALYILGILPVLTDTNMSIDKEVMDDAEQLFGDLLMSTVIKRKSELKKMVKTGFSEHYAKQREALSDFYLLVKEVRERVKA